MEKKRKASSEDERAKVRELVFERKDVVECKKSDMITLISKKTAWEEITEKFNSCGLYPHRTSAQKKKMWENLKSKRKQELANEKKDIMRTGGGPSSLRRKIPEDPELDSMGVDIELRDEAVDSDTLLTCSAAYVLVGDQLIPSEEDCYYAMDSFDELDSWDDEFFEQIEERMVTRAPKRYIRDVQNPFEFYNYEQFRRRFRFRKETVLEVLVPLIFNEGEHPYSNRGLPVPPVMKMLIALRFFATSSYQKKLMRTHQKEIAIYQEPPRTSLGVLRHPLVLVVCGDLFSVSQPTVHRIIKEVSENLCQKIGQYIKMPTSTTDLERTRLSFFQKWGFPGVTGLVDGTHIPIIRPGGDNAEVFRNRKGYFSINVQIVSGPNEEIFDIVCRWPGSAHDSRIFDASAIRLRLEQNPRLGHFLGDSGYAQKSYIYTPVLNPISQPQKKYNWAHIKTRSSVERTIGRWKRRFPCLYFELQTKLHNTLRIIPACAILYNIGLQVQDLWDDDDENPSLQRGDVPNQVVNDAATGVQIKNVFINRYFS